VKGPGLHWICAASEMAIDMTEEKFRQFQWVVFRFGKPNGMFAPPIQAGSDPTATAR